MPVSYLTSLAALSLLLAPSSFAAPAHMVFEQVFETVTVTGAPVAATGTSSGNFQPPAGNGNNQGVDFRNNWRNSNGNFGNQFNNNNIQNSNQNSNQNNNQQQSNNNGQSGNNNGVVPSPASNPPTPAAKAKAAGFAASPTSSSSSSAASTDSTSDDSSSGSSSSSGGGSDAALECPSHDGTYPGSWCLPDSPQYQLETFKAQFLNATNTWRKNYQAEPLTWSDELASFGKSQSDKCIWQHTGKSNSYGENLGSNYNGATAMVDAFGSEYKKFPWSNPNAEQGSHFSQMVWQKTTKAGCGLSWCGGKNGNNGWMAFCEYDPPGNYAGQFDKNVCNTSGPCGGS